MFICCRVKYTDRWYCYYAIITLFIIILLCTYLLAYCDQLLRRRCRAKVTAVATVGRVCLSSGERRPYWTTCETRRHDHPTIFRERKRPRRDTPTPPTLYRSTSHHCRARASPCRPHGLSLSPPSCIVLPCSLYAPRAPTYTPHPPLKTPPPRRLSVPFCLLRRAHTIVFLFAAVHVCFSSLRVRLRNS